MKIQNKIAKMNPKIALIKNKWGWIELTNQNRETLWLDIKIRYNTILLARDHLSKTRK